MVILGDLFNVDKILENIKCNDVPFDVNKDVIIKPTFRNGNMFGLVSFHAKVYEINFKQFMWQITFADFLGVDNGNRIYKLDGMTVVVNACGMVSPSSLIKLEKRILSEFISPKKLEKLEKV